ncbi:Protein ALP1-like [Chionoecetes opilio]|uniref:Protein ALP1-like n=1 Tax=Chionoecetes opilio TaxID=41210 RepID=A0A8J4Y4L6_CHIOP|nr:Protein ALP1-like [Chionoecetes opilio]
MCIINRRRRAKKRAWIRSWLARREKESVYHRLLKELSLEDHETMKNWIRLDKDQYHKLLQLVTPLIAKKDTRMRKAVTAGERLTLTLRYLATGESHASLGCQFRISHYLISSIIPSVCRAIYQVLKQQFLRFPTNQSEWQEAANDYFTQWNFPMCIGALDGKRVLISKPPRSGSEYYDYKGHFTLIMMALVDADCNFMYVDVGASGRASDSGVWDRCGLKDALEKARLNIPPVASLPFSNRQCAYVIVGDDAFPLKKHLMKPYPGRDLTDEKLVFNYRLSRARRTSENAFRILAGRFQVFKEAINTSPDNVKDIVLATLALHNYLRVHAEGECSSSQRTHRNDTETGDWHNERHGGLEPLPVIGRRHGNEARVVRETFTAYFNNEGRVPWQAQMIHMH